MSLSFFSGRLLAAAPGLRGLAIFLAVVSGFPAGQATTLSEATATLPTSLERRMVTAPSQDPLLGVASWYGGSHEGKMTANGEIHHGALRTAAHRHLAFGTVLRVTNLSNGRTSLVRVNDRGPYVAGRTIDLSERAARDLAMLRDGVAMVRLEVIGVSPAKRQR